MFVVLLMCRDKCSYLHACAKQRNTQMLFLRCCPQFLFLPIYIYKSITYISSISTYKHIYIYIYIISISVFYIYISVYIYIHIYNLYLFVLSISNAATDFFFLQQGFSVHLLLPLQDNGYKHVSIHLLNLKTNTLPTEISLQHMENVLYASPTVLLFYTGNFRKYCRCILIS